MVEPYYSEKNITIYLGDCRQILPELPKVDLVLTDPPYGIGIANNPFRQKFAVDDWDDKPLAAIDIPLILQSAEKAIIWGGNYFNLPPCQRFLIWDKVQPQSFSSAMCEMAWTNLEGPAKLFRRRVVEYTKFHPTQKPLDLFHWCLSFAQGSIVDPFMGSGTTLLAAKQLGRPAVGIELSAEYCDIAIERLKQDVFDFTEPLPAVAVAATLFD